MMKISVVSSKIVKPAYGSGGGGGGDGAPPPSSSAADIVPLSVFDKVTFDQYISSMHFFRPPAPTTAALELGLAKMLAEFRVWAGRLVVVGANLGVLLNDAGARFVEATADDASSLDSVMPREPTPEVKALLHPSGDGDDAEGALMLVQVTRFACGGYVVGTTVRHTVTDGRAARSFMTAWGQATRGVAIRPRPVHDRVSFFRPRDPPRVEFEHRGAEFCKPIVNKPAPRGGGDEEGSVVSPDDSDDNKVVMHRVRFTREMLCELKSRASADTGKTYSTLQCVVAHLWACVTRARGLDGGVVTRARIAVNGRSRMRGPDKVPEEYVGNVVLWAWPATTARELVVVSNSSNNNNNNNNSSRPAAALGHTAELISRALSRVDDAYFRSFIDFATSGAVEEEGLAPTADPGKTVLSPDIEVDSLLGFPFQELDFGGGPPFFYMPSYLPVEGGIFLVPSFSGDGSVDAYVPLFTRNLEAFKSCCYSLTAVGDARL